MINIDDEDGRSSRDIADQPWVIGPLGQPLTKNSLPPAGCRYWTSRMKAEVVAAVTGGLLGIDEVLERYQLSVEEFAGWQRALDRFGMSGLKQTKIKRYRDLQERVQRSGWAAQGRGLN